MRLRRSVAWREKDAELTQDPYRTRVGTSEAAVVLWAVVAGLVVAGVIIGAIILTRG